VFNDIKLNVNSEYPTFQVFRFVNALGSGEALMSNKGFKYSVQMFLYCVFIPKGTDYMDKGRGTLLFNFLKNIPKDVAIAQAQVEDMFSDALTQCKQLFSNLVDVDPKKLLSEFEILNMYFLGNRPIIQLRLLNHYRDSIDLEL
jgi:hypothetical protein